MGKRILKYTKTGDRTYRFTEVDDLLVMLIWLTQYGNTCVDGSELTMTLDEDIYEADFEYALNSL